MEEMQRFGAQFNAWWMLKFVTLLRVLKHGNRKSPNERTFFYVFFWEHHVINRGIFQQAMFGCRRVQIPDGEWRFAVRCCTGRLGEVVQVTHQSCCWAESMKPEWRLNRNGHGSEMVYEWIHILCFYQTIFYIVSGVKFYLTGIFIIFTNQLVNAYCIKDYMGIFFILPSQFWCNFTHVFLVFIPTVVGNTLNPTMLCAWHPMTVMSIVFILNLRSAGYHSQCSYHHIMYMISDVEDYKQNIIPPNHIYIYIIIYIFIHICITRYDSTWS